MRAWLQHHRFSLAQTLSRLARSPVATFLNMLVIGVALALPLGGYAVLGNLETLSGTLTTESQLSVFLAGDAAENDVSTIESRLKAANGVRSVRFVDRNSALAGLKRAPGMAEVIATLRDNPLPDAFVVTLATSDPGLADRLEQEFRSLPKVAHVQVDSAWLRRLDTLLHLGRTTVVLLGALLGIALIAVMFNTIRLQILTQRDEIEVSRLIGATRAYIRRPFFYLGSLLGLLGGLAALGIVYIALTTINRDIVQLAALYGADFRLRFPSPGDAGAALLASVILGWLGAYLSVSKHLREIDIK